MRGVSRKTARRNTAEGGPRARGVGRKSRMMMMAGCRTPWWDQCRGRERKMRGGRLRRRRRCARSRPRRDMSTGVASWVVARKSRRSMSRSLGRDAAVSGVANASGRMEEKTKRGMTSGILDRSEEVRRDETRSRAEALCAAVWDREGDRVGLIDGRCVTNQKPRVESRRRCTPDRRGPSSGDGSA
jgi:hypothetical protein